MSIYYPQAAVILNILWEDFGSGDKRLETKSKIPINCRNIHIERNDYNEADTARLTIDYKAFPFDPRCVRACGVTIFMQNKKCLYDSEYRAVKIEPNNLAIENINSNKVFVGFVDESSIKLDDSEKVVMMECRDFTSLLIDFRRVNTTPVSKSKPIDKMIRELLDEQPATKDIIIENRTGGEFVVPAKNAAELEQESSSRNPKKKDSYWDIIYDLADELGLIVFIELDKLVISKPQNIYEKKNIKQFIWGKNIKDIEFKRKLGRAKDFNIEVVSFNQSAGKVEKVKIPLEATNPDVKGPEVSIPQLDKNGNLITPPKPADYIKFKIKDVVSREALIEKGEGIFQEMTRQQIEGSLTTYEMEIPEEIPLKNGEVNTKVIKFNEMKNGTAIRVFLDSEEINQLKNNSTIGAKTAFLEKRGYPRDIAVQFATSLDKINTAFYVRSVSFTMDQENGFEMKIDFINFIDIDSSLK